MGIGVRKLTLKDRMTQALATTGGSKDEQDKFLLAMLAIMNGTVSVPNNTDRPEESPPVHPLLVVHNAGFGWWNF